MLTREYFTWTIKTDQHGKALYLTMIEVLEKDILISILQPGKRLPTIRKLATMVGVTVSTAACVYKEANKLGLLTAVVGRGIFVTVDTGKRVTVIDVGESDVSWDMGLPS